MIKLLKTIFKRLWTHKAILIKVGKWLLGNLKSSWDKFSTKYPNASAILMLVGGFLGFVAVGVVLVLIDKDVITIS